MEIFGSNTADLVVDSVFGVADLNQKGVITPVDMMVMQFVASDMLDHIAKSVIRSARQTPLAHCSETNGLLDID